MAKRVVTLIRDQLDRSEFPEGQGGTFEFSIRGEHYRITTSNSHYQQLLNALAPLMAAADRLDAQARVVVA